MKWKSSICFSGCFFFTSSAQNVKSVQFFFWFETEAQDVKIFFNDLLARNRVNISLLE